MFITDSQLGANWELTGSGLGAELCLPPAQRAPIRSRGELGGRPEAGSGLAGSLWAAVTELLAGVFKRKLQDFCIFIPSSHTPGGQAGPADIYN